LGEEHRGVVFGGVLCRIKVEKEVREDRTRREDEREGEEVEDGFEQKGDPDRCAGVVRVELDHRVRGGGFVGGHRREFHGWSSRSRPRLRLRSGCDVDVEKKKLRRC
jgi:hypothetical protein